MKDEFIFIHNRIIQEIYRFLNSYILFLFTKKIEIHYILFKEKKSFENLRKRKEQEVVLSIFFG